MTGRDAPSPWPPITKDALDRATRGERDHCDSEIRAVRELVESYRAAAAVHQALIAQLRSEAHDNIREQVEGLAQRFLTAVDAQQKSIDDLRDRVVRAEGKSAGIGSSWAVLVALISAAAAVVAIVINVT